MPCSDKQGQMNTVQKRNYQKELENILASLQKTQQVPRLLLHSCCAPCSSYVLEYLSEWFEIEDFFYNPNISPQEEYQFRADELTRLIREMPLPHPVHFVEGRYDPERFYEMARGLEQVPEGGERCLRCFALRLEEAAQEAKNRHCDYFATTLTISPLKNAQEINRIGEETAARYGIQYLPSDFKKRDGYKRSLELSREYDLYRQNYCGCVFSRKAREAEDKEQQQGKE